MANGFVVNALLNASKWLRGAKSMEDSIDDLEGALEDASDEVKQLDRQGERAFKEIEDGAEDAEKEASELEKRLRKVRDEAKDVGKAGDDIGDSGKRGFVQAGDAAGEFKEEALANFSEITSSFDGSMESIGELAQGTLGGVASAIPGIGLAAGAAAAGIGLATAAWQDVQEATEEARQGAWEYAFAVAESGEWQAASDAVAGITQDSEKMAEAQKIATATGWDLQDVVIAMATGKGLPQLRQELQASALEVGNNAYEIYGLDQMLGGLEQGFYQGADAAKVHRKIIGDLAKDYGKATGEVDDLGNSIYELPDGKKVVVDARTGEAHEDLDALEKRKIPVKTVKVKATVDDSAVRNYNPKTKRMNVVVKPVDRYGRSLE